MTYWCRQIVRPRSDTSTKVRQRKCLSLKRLSNLSNLSDLYSQIGLKNSRPWPRAVRAIFKTNWRNRLYRSDRLDSGYFYRVLRCPTCCNRPGRSDTPAEAFA